MGKKRFKLRLPVAAWQPLLLYALLIAGVGTLLWFSLGTLVQGYSGNEATTLAAGDSWRTIFNHPLNAPFHVMTRLLLYVQDNGLLATRIVATVIGLATLVVFYALVRLWHGERTAIFGTLLFAVSAWFLHTVRLGVPDVVLFSILILVGTLVWSKHTGSRAALFMCFGLASILLYVPGMIWLIVLGVIWQWRTIDRLFKQHLWIVTVGALLLVAVLAPLTLAAYHDPHILKEIAGLPATGWPEPQAILRNLADIPLSLFWHTPANPEHWLVRLPILDYFGMAMLFLGGYVYVRHMGLDRSRLIAIILLAGIVLIGLGGAVTLTLIIPFVYMLIAAGTGFLLERWYTVFPRNTIAQATGLVLVCLVIAASTGYNLRHYFQAWPGALGTKHIFIVEPVASSDKLKG